MNDDSQEMVYLAALVYMLRNGLGHSDANKWRISNTGSFGESVVDGGIGQVKMEQGALACTMHTAMPFKELWTAACEISCGSCPRALKQVTTFGKLRTMGTVTKA